MPVLKIKPEHEPSQGKFVLINSEDFDPDKHELYDEDQPHIDAEQEPDSAHAENILADEKRVKEPSSTTEKTTKRGNK